MANVSFQSGTLATLTTTVVVATDNILGVSYQRTKIAQGDTGVATDVTSAIGLWVTQATSNWTVQPSSQFTVTTTPSTQMTVSVTPTSALSIGLITSTSTLVSQYIATIPTSQITASVTPTSQFTVTTTPSSQITASVTPTSALTIGLITSTSTLISQFISTVPSSQWTVTTTPSSQATVSVTPTTQFTVTTTPSSVVNVTTTPSSQMTVTTTPSTTLTVIQSTATNFPLNIAQDWNTVYGSSGNIKYAPAFVYGTLATSGSSALLTLVASGVGVAPLLLSAVINAPTAATVSLCGVTAGTATTLARFAVATAGSFVMPFNQKGWLQPASASALAMVLSSATTAAANINISYIASTV